MGRLLLAMCAASIAVGACKEPSPLYPAGASPDVVEACALADRKCTGCHDRERYEGQRHTPERWTQLVHKMRLLPGSGITPADADVIIRCLNYRSGATSFDIHPRGRTDERVAMYATSPDEVQALHFDLHNDLHLDAGNTASPWCKPLK